MNDLARHVASLRLRLRLQMLLMAGAITIGLFALGGADVIARTLVESDAWKVRTRKADAATVVDRLIVTTDADNARIKVINANIELAQQATLPTTGVVEGTVAYDSTAKQLKFYNGTAWVASGSGTGGGGTSGATPGGRLVGGGTSLSYGKYSSDFIEVNGEQVQISTSALGLSTGTFLIDANGANTTSTMVDGVTYFIYVSNSQATAAAKALRGSAVEGGEYLGASGQALNWRKVGMVRLNGSGQFEDSDVKRYIYNRFNKLQRRLYVRPGYTDNNAFTTFAATNTTWFPINNGIGSRLEFLSEFGELTELHAETTVVKAGGGDVWIGISNVNQPPATQTFVQNSAYTNVALTHYVNNNFFDHSYYCDLQVRVTGGSATFAIDNVRTGTQTTDPPITQFYGTIWN